MDVRFARCGREINVNRLFSKEVPETSYRVLRIFH